MQMWNRCVGSVVPIAAGGGPTIITAPTPTTRAIAGTGVTITIGGDVATRGRRVSLRPPLLGIRLARLNSYVSVWKRTLCAATVMSASGRKQTSPALGQKRAAKRSLFDHFVGAPD